MSEIKLRLELAEEELRFKMWVRFHRLLESMNEETLAKMSDGDDFSPTQEPPPGASRLDTLDRATLTKLWKASEQTWKGRSREDLKFFRRHMHWAEQACPHNCVGREMV